MDENEFLLKRVQPALTGLIDGSISTLAPLFAAAFATHNTHTAFLIGLACAVGAAISMAFSEGMSDTGELTGRGRPVLRGSITGVATGIGGIGHTLPFLIPNFHVALLSAMIVVGIELITIAFVRYKYFNISFFRSAVQVIIGGLLVFGAGILIGTS